MNIVVIGGGQPGKFGNDFANQAKEEGHNVLILSHRDYGTNDPTHAWADFSERQSVVDQFRLLTADLDRIDIFLYNTAYASYPSDPSLFKSTANVSTVGWISNLYVNVLLPHVLSVEALKKMGRGSKLVFMTTRMALQFNRTEYTDMAGYAGTKATQTHLMLALAYHNDRGAIATSISPHFPYDNKEEYRKTFEKTYEYILTFDQNAIVKII
jgi:NAD(P)-dependent dehydrogenase (short-subunit alcohol dehydrogenase family)